MFSAEQNRAILSVLEATLNSEFNEPVVKNLANYLGGEMAIQYPTDEESYTVAIKTPMEAIFHNIKDKLQVHLGQPIVNAIYEPMHDTNLYLSVALFGRYGNYYFNSTVPSTDGPIANTYKNSPLQNNMICANKNSDGSYSPFNGNTVPGEMEVMLSHDPNHVSTSIGFVPLSYKKTGYRACRKLVNHETGIVGGGLVIALYNVHTISKLPPKQYQIAGKWTNLTGLWIGIFVILLVILFFIRAAIFSTKKRQPKSK